jgi:hypothetical protein
VAAERVGRRVSSRAAPDALCGLPGVTEESMGLDRTFAVAPQLDGLEPDVPEGGCGGGSRLDSDWHREHAPARMRPQCWWM